VNARNIAEDCEGSLQRLGTDHLDLYLVRHLFNGEEKRRQPTGVNLAPNLAVRKSMFDVIRAILLRSGMLLCLGPLPPVTNAHAHIHDPSIVWPHCTCRAQLHWPARYTPQANWGQSLAYRPEAQMFWKGHSSFAEVAEAMGKLIRYCSCVGIAAILAMAIATLSNHLQFSMTGVLCNLQSHQGQVTAAIQVDVLATA
jgi:hypothetical protein